MGLPELDELLALSEEPAGARFRLADLQLHTPVDRNFRPGVHLDTDAQRSAFAADYVATALAAGLEIVAITEHNDVTWIDVLREAPGASDLLIFPAFEVASSEGVHVLCLWETSETAARLDEVLVEIGLPTNRRRHSDGTPRGCKHPLGDLVAFIQDSGGLCILAHVDREDGVLHRLTGEPRTRAWLESGALAVQCSKNPQLMDENSFYRRALTNEGGQYQRDRPYACIQTSDARKLEEIGTKPTYIKMSSDSIEGLRQAFLDAESRIRFPDEHVPRAYPKILAARWDGCFLEAGLPLNPNLNCLIGGKGTAKSTAIETIRHAFDLPIESKTIREQAFALLEETFPSSGKISLLVEVSEPRPSRYVIERTGQDRPLVRAADSLEIVEGLLPSSLFRPVVFGQKEIYETAMRLDSQLKLLDRYCSGDLEPLKEREARLMSDITAESDEIRRVSAEIATADDRLAELPILQERKRLFDEAGLAEKLAEQNQLERERAAIDAAEELLGEYEALARDLRAKAESIGALPALEETPNRDLMTSIGVIVDDLATEWSRVGDEVELAISKARERLEEVRRTWAERFEDRRAAFDAAVKDVAGEHGEDNIRDYLRLDARIDRLNALRTQNTARQLAVEGAIKDRREWLSELREVRRQIFLIRDRVSGELSGRLDGAVQIVVKHQGNRDSVLKALRGLRSGVGQKQLEQLVGRSNFSPARLAELSREGADVLAQEYELSTSAAQQLLRVLDEESLDKIELIPLDDLVDISLNVGSPQREEFRTLTRLSAGQKSTAILLLALLESDGPLILDQPEDDLDNRFIYDDVVQRLRGAKEQRQFLIATHNANIPVLGDAEQIVVLDTRANGDRVHAAIVARGSIDDAALHGGDCTVEDVLEGGREAFQLRRDKYGF